MKFYSPIAFILLLYPTISIHSQYSAYHPSFSNPISASLVSYGVAFEDRSAHLFYNPSLLLQNSRNVISGGISANYGLDSVSPILPSALGFYVASDYKYGWGMSFKRDYERFFPYPSKLQTYTSVLYFTYSISDSFHISTGLGPSYSMRAKSNSNYSWSYFASASYIYSSWTFGFSYNYTGKFNYQDYRGGDKLTEVFPERISLGVYKIFDTNQSLYLELNRFLWERSSFGLNGYEEKAKFDRGIGAEAKGSLGYQYKYFDFSFPIYFRSGLEIGGSYNDTGRNERHLGIGLGASLLMIENNYSKDTLSIDFSISDFSMFKTKGKFPETIFLFALKYEWGEVLERE